MKKKKVVLLIAAVASLAMLAPISVTAAYGTVAKSASITRKKAVNGKFYSEFTSLAELVDAGMALNKEITDEGMTLLKNDGTLPLSGVKKISVLGKSSVNPQYAGSGSGASGGTVISLLDALTEVGYTVNPVVEDFYNNNTRSGVGPKVASFFGGGGEITIGETPKASYDDSVIDSFSHYHDAAIVLLKRSGSEGSDNPRRCGDFATDSDAVKNAHHYFQLSENEKDLIAMAEANFDKVVVVLNTPSPIEVQTLKNDAKINGVIWAGLPGGTGFRSLAGILNGDVNPSGHTVDTWAADYRKDPTWNNFGDGSQTSSDMTTANYTLLTPGGKNITGRFNAAGEDVQGTDAKGSGLSVIDKFVSYEEGIYTGYRYYETAAHDAADPAAWYKENVVYPFGYGLSYTNFDYSAVTVSGTMTDDKITAKVTVTNHGTVAGKDVVEAYFKAPYINGGLEKAYEVMAGYQKTDVIQPGKSQEVTIEFYLQDVASYDITANSGKGAYVLDAGNYGISLNSDAHTVIGTEATLNLASTRTFTTDRTTGGEIKNAFQGANASLPSASGLFTGMTRASANHFVQPAAPVATDMKVDSKMLSKLINVFQASNLDDGTSWYKKVYGEDDPRAIDAATKKNFTDGTWKQQPETGTREAVYKTFQDLADLDFDDDTEWNKVLNNLKYTEMTTLIERGGWSTAACNYIGKNSATDRDGPAGLGNVAYAVEVNIAATFNDELARRFGELNGEESLWTDIPGWYAPAADHHRSVFGGRNFEYYSEDPILGGHMAGNTIAGAQSKGAHVYLKHYACNDQETTRSGISTFATEQTLREVNLRTFEIAVKIGQPKGMMGGMNRIGVVENYGNYGLMTQTLRNEWGFKGCVDTDAGTDSNVAGTRSPILMYTSGTNLNLGTFNINAATVGAYDATSNTVKTGDTPVYSFWYHVRQNAKAVLYETSHSNEVNNRYNVSAFKKQEFTMTGLIANSQSIAVDTTALGTTNVSYAVTKGTLPDGVTLDGKTGLLSGTPTVFGDTTVTVTMYVDGWIKQTADIVIHVVSPLACTGADLTALKVGTAVTGTLSNTAYTVGGKITVAGFRGSSTYTIKSVEYSATSLPDGLTLGTDGALTGTPTAAGVYNATVAVKAAYDSTNAWTGQTTTAYATLNIPATITVNNADGTAPVVDTRTDAEKAADQAKADAAAAQAAADEAAAKAAAAQAEAEAAKAAADAAAKAAEEKAAAAQAEVDAKAAAAAAAAEEAKTQAATAEAAAAKATDDANAKAAAAQKVGVTGLILGVIGLIAGAAACILVFFKKK